MASPALRAAVECAYASSDDRWGWHSPKPRLQQVQQRHRARLAPPWRLAALLRRLPLPLRAAGHLRERKGEGGGRGREKAAKHHGRSVTDVCVGSIPTKEDGRLTRALTSCCFRLRHAASRSADN